jgi:integrase
MQCDTLAMTQKLNEVMRRRWTTRNKESQFVFCKPDGSRYTRDDHFIKQFMPRLCKKAKVKPFGFHAIRHRVAAILMDSGKATLGDIQHFLRQRRATTTEIYLRSLKPGSQEMAGILDALTEDGKQDKNSRKM